MGSCSGDDSSSSLLFGDGCTNSENVNMMKQESDTPRYGRPIQIPPNRIPTVKRPASIGVVHMLLDTSKRVMMVNNLDRCSASTCDAPILLKKLVDPEPRDMTRSPAMKTGRDGDTPRMKAPAAYAK